MDWKRDRESKELRGRMFEEKQPNNDAQDGQHLGLPARQPDQFHKAPPTVRSGRLPNSAAACQWDQAGSRLDCSAACAASSASAARERWIMSTQSWNACASFSTSPLSGPSLRHPFSSKLSSVTWPRYASGCCIMGMLRKTHA